MSCKQSEEAKGSGLNAKKDKQPIGTQHKSVVRTTEEQTVTRVQLPQVNPHKKPENSRKQDYHKWNKNTGLPYMERKETGRPHD